MCFPLLGVGDFVDREGLKGFGLRGEYANSEYGIPPPLVRYSRVLAGTRGGSDGVAGTRPPGPVRSASVRPQPTDAALRVLRQPGLCGAL